MRFGQFLLCLSFVVSSSIASSPHGDKHIAIRQESTDSAFPTLTSASQSAQPSSTITSQSRESSERPTQSLSLSATTASSGGNSAGDSTTTDALSSSVSDTITTTGAPRPTPSSNSTTNGTASAADPVAVLPLPPRITPALSVAGVILLLTGVAYALIGVKNKWVHVFLSTAYLASLATLVLIIYVINPPIKDTIQGAYFVGVFMAGLILGGGALIFKDITEGLGCLLGGFCLSMWFLTLKPGGLVTNTGGKAIFVAVFCIVCWSLSFSHYTRAYGLIGSTSFAGATAFVLGIDCFSKGGLKEFWVYLWNLNDDLFPLNTNTYPITRGIRVETVVIILGTIIGVISQIKLWKVVQNRHKQREAVQAEEERRRDAVEEALGRHLERQNDRDRSEWEKRYGDRLDAKRNTVLWSETHDENKIYPSTSTTELASSRNSDSNESLEMTSVVSLNAKSSLHGSKSKRQSNISVQPIQEVEEDEDELSEKKGVKHDSILAEVKTGEHLPHYAPGLVGFDQVVVPSPQPEQHELTEIVSRESQPQANMIQSLKPLTTRPSSRKTSTRLQLSEEDAKAKKRNSIPSLKDLRRRSMQSLSSKGPKDEGQPLDTRFLSESKEALIIANASVGTHSRASSVAATLDDENERLDMPALDVHEDLKRDSRPPHIVISPVHGLSLEDQFKAGLHGPPSPSGLSDQFGIDPEELVRPPTAKAHGILDFGFGSDSKRTSGGNTDALWEEGPKSSAVASQTSIAEGLTKGALEQVPSQMSNVVLSYRTNEWAKHIATAEAPIFEEPDPVTLNDAELSTRLADPSSPSLSDFVSEDQIINKPAPVASPINSVAPSEAGIKVNPGIQPPEAVRSMSTLVNNVSTSTTPSGTSSQTYNTNLRSFTDPTQLQQHAITVQAPVALRTSRRTSNPMQRQPSVLQSTPIDENLATDFTSRLNAPKRSSTTSQQFYSPGSSQVDVTRPGSTSQAQNYPSAFKRSSSFNLHQNLSQPDLRPATAHTSSPYSMNNGMAMRSETRLPDYGSKSHQPLQRNNTNEFRRENLMADWRTGLAQSHTTTVVPNTGVDNRYAQQMHDYEAGKFRKEQEKHNRARKEAAIDQSMRTQGMIDAHREVLKKMQSQANKKLTV